MSDDTDEQGEAAPPPVLRDVAVFQFKLIMDGLRDLALVPVSLAAAVLDLLDRSHEPGHYFYRVVRMGRQTEHFIDLFEAADRVDHEHARDLPIGERKLDSLIEEVEQRFQKAQAEDPLSEQRIRERLRRLADRAKVSRGDQ